MSVKVGVADSQVRYRAADLRQPDEQGWTPIHHAAFQGHVKSINRFVSIDLKAILRYDTIKDLHIKTEKKCQFSVAYLFSLEFSVIGAS